ncbi:MAG: hypothetical protein HPY89_09535 [Pelotomaculum sp.]|uniref:Hypothetical membrabe protein n=1 Tax=Pelotomaculum thermopropionicum (strain DSM 13744 / JCM 10971 / SI) TaxID=370438 RepID=A5D4S9_PELTS|nr:hypothetical protein [Pelotomaculum sp.]BAF58752.1 hypothetical membrabe protein [Pelotomaculum thermopropionicum SI]
MKRTVCYGFCIFLLLIIAPGCRPGGETKTGTSAVNGLDKDNQLLQFFVASHPENVVVKCAAADLNADSLEDLVVIYRQGADKCGMLVVLSQPAGYVFTNEVAAPVSGQVITFKDIDDKPPLEFIVQGMKGANAGYAIFRVEGTRLEDLFGEGMKDCC